MKYNTGFDILKMKLTINFNCRIVTISGFTSNKYGSVAAESFLLKIYTDIVNLTSSFDLIDTRSCSLINICKNSNDLS